MKMPSLEIQREVGRLRRWLETSGANYRLLAPICAAEDLRERAVEGLRAGGVIRVRQIDVGDGELIPDEFRNYRGTHTSFTLFQFAGLARRIARDGLEVLAELDRAEPLFVRPATWALLWLEDPLLVPLIAAHAPRLQAAIELQPVLASPDLFTGRAPAELVTLAEAVARAGAGTPFASALGAGVLRERSDLPGLRQLLKANSFDLPRWLLTGAEAALLGADPHQALALYAAAVRLDGPEADQARVGAAELLLRLGDPATAFAVVPPIQRLAPQLAVRVCVAEAAIDSSTPAAAADDAAAEDPEALRLLAGAVGLDPARRCRTLERAVAAAKTDPVLQDRLRLEWARALLDDAQIDQARDLLDRPTGSPAALTLQARLARLAAASEPATAADQLAAAGKLLDRAVADARASNSVGDELDAQWERVAIDAANGDLDRVMVDLEAIEQRAAAAGLRDRQHRAQIQRARALRVAGQLAKASGVIDQLDALGKDIGWPAIEIDSLVVRAEHVEALGTGGEANRLYERASRMAKAIGAEGLARELAERAERPEPKD